MSKINGKPKTSRNGGKILMVISGIFILLSILCCIVGSNYSIMSHIRKDFPGLESSLIPLISFGVIICPALFITGIAQNSYKKQTQNAPSHPQNTNPKGMVQPQGTASPRPQIPEALHRRSVSKAATTLNFIGAATQGAPLLLFMSSLISGNSRASLGLSVLLTFNFPIFLIVAILGNLRTKEILRIGNKEEKRWPSISLAVEAILFITALLVIFLPMVIK